MKFGGNEMASASYIFENTSGIERWSSVKKTTLGAFIWHLCHFLPREAMHIYLQKHIKSAEQRHFSGTTSKMSLRF